MENLDVFLAWSPVGSGKFGSLSFGLPMGLSDWLVLNGKEEGKMIKIN